MQAESERAEQAKPAASAAPGLKLDDDSCWGAAAEDYQKLSAFPFMYGQDAAALLNLQRGESVLEVACGTGDLACHMAAKHGVSVQAIDFAAGMIEAGQKHPDAASADVTLCVMDGTKLEFPDSSFDAAISNFGVFLFPEREKGMREMLRVLKPGGRIVMTSWTNDRNAMIPGQRFLAEYAPECLPFPTMPGEGEVDTVEGLKHALTAIGAVHADAQEVTHMFETESGNAMARPLMSNPAVKSMMKKVDADKHDALPQALAAYLTEQYPREGGGVSFPATAVVGFAYKA